MTSSGAILQVIAQAAEEWAKTAYPYHTLASLGEPIKSFVRHPADDVEIEQADVLLFLMSAGVQHGSNWYFWVQKCLSIPEAPDRLVAALATGYDRVTYRALYALQLFDKTDVQRALDRSPKNLRPLINKVVVDHVFNGKVLSYVQEQTRSHDAEKAKKAAAVVREITNMCTTAPDFGKGDKKKVFISYNHRDAAHVEKIKLLIDGENLGIIIDTDYLRFGDNIKEFIRKSVRESDYTLAVISRNSLLSPWVIHEALETFMHEQVSGVPKYQPIVIDTCFYQNSFYLESVESIEQGIYELADYISALSKKGLTTKTLDDKKNQLIKLRNEMDTVLSRLSDNLHADCTTHEKMEENIKKLCGQLLER